MADKVAMRIAMPAQNFPGQTQDVITFAIAVYIVVWFEVIEIDIAGAERVPFSSSLSICSSIGTLPGKSVSGLA